MITREILEEIASASEIINAALMGIKNLAMLADTPDEWDKLADVIEESNRAITAAQQRILGAYGRIK